MSFEAEEYDPNASDAPYYWIAPVVLGIVTGVVTQDLLMGVVVFTPLICLWALWVISLPKPDPNDRRITYDDDGINIQEYGSTETVSWSAVISVSEQVDQQVALFGLRGNVLKSYVYVIVYRDKNEQVSTIESTSARLYIFAQEKCLELKRHLPPATNDNHLTLGHTTLQENEPN